MGTILEALAACIGDLLAEELKAWLPRITEHLIRCAIKILPNDQRERYGEEWRSYVGEVPGQLSKLCAAFGLIRAAYVIADLRLVQGLLARLAALILLILFGPGILMMRLTFKVAFGHAPKMVLSPMKFSDCVLRTYAFVTPIWWTKWSPYAALRSAPRITPMTQGELVQLRRIADLTTVNYKLLIFLLSLLPSRYPVLLNIVRGDIPVKYLRELL